MVLRDIDHEEFYLKIDGKWIFIDQKILRSHPGGSAIETYRNMDATTVFHTFHINSKTAYKVLSNVIKEQKDTINIVPNIKVQKDELIAGIDDVNLGEYNLTKEQANKMSKNFDLLRMKVRLAGLLDGENTFFIRKFCEAIGIIAMSIFFQTKGYYIISALLMGLAWQQLGWMIHEYCHHQHFRNHFFNDLMSYIVGNFLQGFSSGGWKEQHNVHHAATNVVGRDGDLDLMPFWATVVSDLKLIDNSVLLYLIPYQHLYWAFALPLLRLSWLIQSIVFVSTMDSHFFETRLIYFAVSQLFAGFLLAHVVTYNHYSTDKFPHNAKIMENYACLQLYTTRNMRSGLFIDWLWGGLNYQIEHHLFPTVPRSNLKKLRPFVQEFCKENNLPYMVDDYMTGWEYEIEQFSKVARIASKFIKKKSF